MARGGSGQNWIGALVVSAGSVAIALMTLLDSPAQGEMTEAVPDWYGWMTTGLHGIVLLFLLLFLAQTGRITADRPALRLPTLAAILVGIAAAAYVLARDFNLV